MARGTIYIDYANKEGFPIDTWIHGTYKPDRVLISNLRIGFKINDPT